MNTVKYLEKKVGRVTIDFSSQNTIDSAYTFDAADISEALDQITITGHPYKTGDLVSPILTATTGVTATAPAVGTAYYVIYVDANTISLATSLALAKAGTATALTAGSAADVFLQRDCFGAVATGLVIPDNAVVTNVYVDVTTDLKSWDGAWGAGNEDKATVALSLLSANDVISAVAIEAAGDVWDAGVHGSIIGAPALGSDAATLDSGTAILFAAEMAATALKMTSDAELTMTIAVDPIGTGLMDVYVEYLEPTLA